MSMCQVLFYTLCCLLSLGEAPGVSREPKIMGLQVTGDDLQMTFSTGEVF